MNPTPLRLAVLISGGGTTLKNLLAAIAQGDLTAEVAVVVSSKATAKGLQFADDAGIPRHVVVRDGGMSDDDYRESIFALCRASQVDLVVMAGFLKHVLIPEDFEGRVLNIHPSLIPAFCGKGYYGHHVHQAVLDYGAKVSGCTVHFVDNEYDHGPILLQRVVRVEDGDTADDLAARVFAEECKAYPEAIQAIADGRVEHDGRRVLLR